MATAGGKPLLLLIGSSSRRSREFILQSVSRRYALWLLQPVPVGWEEPYVVGDTVVDNTRPEPLIDAARQVATEHPVAGVFCYDEGLVEPAAHAAQALGLPGNSPEAIVACRDKHTTRAVLAQTDVAQPASIAVRSPEEARKAADELGFPIVLKPRGLAGSMGVSRVDRPEDLDGAYRDAAAASYPDVPVFDTVLVEQYVDGPEISVDSVFFEGGCVPLVVAHKQVGLAPFFEEFGHEVDGADPLLSDPALTAALRTSHAALGYHTGVTHTEFRLTPHGPVLMEINARLGGDMIPYLGWLTTGVDVAMAAADVAAGRRPDTEPRHRKAAAVTFLYPDHDIVIDEVVIRESNVPPEVHSVTPLVNPGAVLRLPPRGYISRYARVITVADSMERARAALRLAPEIVTLTGHAAEEPIR